MTTLTNRENKSHVSDEQAMELALDQARAAQQAGDIPVVHIGRSVRYDARSLDLWIRARESSRSKTTSGTSRRRVGGEHHSRTKWA